MTRHVESWSLLDMLLVCVLAAFCYAFGAITHERDIQRVCDDNGHVVIKGADYTCARKP